MAKAEAATSRLLELHAPDCPHVSEPRVRTAVPADPDWIDPCSGCSVRPLTICAPLSPRELTVMAEIVTPVTCEAGQPVFDEGEPSTHLFNVTRGAVRVYKLLPDGRRQVTGFLFPGDFLGLSNGEQETYAYSAEAMTEVDLCRFPRRSLEVVIEENIKLEKRLLRMAANELAVAQDQMLLLGRKTARERVASFFLSLSERAVKRGQPGNPISVPMSRTDIADYLGLTTETVSRTVTQLKTEHLIRLLSGGKIELADMDALRDLASGA